MATNRQTIRFAGLDPVPIGLVVVEPISDEALCAAAGLPPSPFIDTLKPYQVLRHSVDSYELALGNGLGDAVDTGNLIVLSGQYFTVSEAMISPE